MQWNHFQTKQLSTKLWKKRFKHFTTLPTNRLSSWQLSGLYWFKQAPIGKIFQHRLFCFIHTNAMKPFSKWTTFYKVLIKAFQIFTTISQKLIIAMVTFQRDNNSIRIRPKRFCNTYWYILLIPMQWNHLHSKQFSTKLWKTFQRMTTSPTNRLSSWQLPGLYWFNQSPTRNMFQHKLVYFIHTNVMKPFSNWTTFYKVLKKCLKHVPL